MPTTLALSCTLDSIHPKGHGLGREMRERPFHANEEPHFVPTEHCIEDEIALTQFFAHSEGGGLHCQGLQGQERQPG